jgi:hypothetical protein
VKNRNKGKSGTRFCDKQGKAEEANRDLLILAFPGVSKVGTER